MNHKEVLAVFLINRDEAKSIKEIAQVIGGQSYVKDLRAVLSVIALHFCNIEPK